MALSTSKLALGGAVAALALGASGQARQLATSKAITGSELETFRRRLAPFQVGFKRWTAVYAIPPGILEALAIKESSGNPKAIGTNGSLNPERWDYGLMQVNARTGRTIAARLSVPSFTLTKLFDPETSIRFAAWLLDDNRRVSGAGDVQSMLSAYNWGLRGGRVVSPVPNPDYTRTAFNWYTYARQGAFA